VTVQRYAPVYLADPVLLCPIRHFRHNLASCAHFRHLNYDARFKTIDDFIRPTENAKHYLSGELSVKAHCLPFAQIPHTTRLFTDFLAYSPSVRPFYPRSPYLQQWVQEESSRISYDSIRRERVSAILARQNKSWDASQKTLANLDRFRKGAATVVTGQQVGLFGGPAFAIYKALTAVKLAEEATRAGVDAVPVFWLATYDHDLAEVNHVSIAGSDGSLQLLTAQTAGTPGAPVANIRFTNSISAVVDQASALLGDTEATNFLRDCYRPGESLGAAFARLYTRIFAEWGVILLDASDPELARIAAPIYRASIERSEEIAGLLLERGKQLESAGYHQQVKVTESTVLLFTEVNGARTAMQRRGSGDQTEFLVDGHETLRPSELLSRIESHPERFSPNVLLRPAVEDYLLPTLAYTGGAAETAYFGQAAVVYEALIGRVTPIIPRFSATIVEPKTKRLLDKHGIAVTDTFNGPENLRREIAARSLPGELQAAFESAKQAFDSSFAMLKQKLEKLDRTLVDAAETSHSKMQHQLEKLHAQAARAEAQKGELVSRHADTLSQALYPDKGLQERGIGGICFLARYGSDLLHQIYQSVHSDCHDHQILEL
jgi:bacillithiol biosynthesis cysteine-adding enzyme BshC